MRPLATSWPRRISLTLLALTIALFAAFAAGCGDSGGDLKSTEPASSPAATPMPLEPTDEVAGEPADGVTTPTPDSALSVERSGNVGGAPGDAAPEFAGISAWINSGSLQMDELQGKVVLIDFWTYTCINCIRTIPYLREWHKKYADQGLVIVGVHTPEFEFEKMTDNVVASTKELGVAWPVAQDNDYRTWRAYSNRYWPAKYLIDAEGIVRYTHFGEGAYDETEQHIRSLLTEAGSDVTGIAVNPDKGPTIDPRAYAAPAETRQTREIYGGRNRNTSSSGLYIANQEYYVADEGSTQDYIDPGGHLNQFMYLHGAWTAGPESIKHGRATENLEDYIALLFFARSVNIVIDFESDEPYEVEVTIAGANSEGDTEPGTELAYRPLTADEAGEHIVIEDGRSYFVVDQPDLYNVVSLPEFGGAELKFASNSPDFALFALTFGSYAETY